MTPKTSRDKAKLIRIVVLIAVLIILFILLKPGDSGDAEDDDKYYYTPVAHSYSFDWNEPANTEQEVTGEVTSVPEGARDKYTVIKGNGKDTVTIMVYMCGADLESQGAMGSYDLQEMAGTSLGDNVNLIVMTGGCTKWHINGISNKVNQIFRVDGNGRMHCLADNAGNASMVDPENLTAFIEFCEENFEANRYELIFWDHGAGTISGYGYDEKNPRAGSMTLDEIDQALTDAGVKFDFIGFDACLMGSTENALMLSEHADYMIASEETEPGIGWYYTPWVQAISDNTSISTVELGKIIVDNFVSRSGIDARGQSATLSVTDLAQVQLVIPEKLAAFARSTSNMINAGEYRTVSKNRGASREFGSSSGMDMVDLTDLASRFESTEARELKKAVLSCVKYNNTSSDMTNSYGLSIYFPYRATKYVNTVLRTYENIQMESSYADCIRSFASYQASGQMASGGSHSAYQSFNSYAGDSYYSQEENYDAIYDLLSLFMTGGYSTNESYSDYYAYDLADLFRGKVDGTMTQFIADNHFDADLTWKNGKLPLTGEQWGMVTDLSLNMFVDDGEGYIDLGKDNIYSIDDKGNLLKQEDLTWLAASADNEHWQIVPYYYIYSQSGEEETVSHGRIPVLYNGRQADLLIRMDNESIEVTGISYGYGEDASVLPKTAVELFEGDELEFVCDYYDYDGNYSDTYLLGDKLTVKDKLYLGDYDVSSYETLVNYEFKDLYQQSYWSDPMK